MKNSLIIFSVILLASCNFKSNKSADTTNTTIENKSLNSGKVDDTEMVDFVGGTFIMGSNSGTPYEKPAHEVKVNAFKLDKSPVTVAQFSKFVEATHFITDAEKFGDSGVYNQTLQNWELKKGAYWLYPLGREKQKAEMNHPVTHVSWNDAQAYCKWAGKRLPTEAEWEYAARNGGKSQSLYSWGESLIINNKMMANVWQGSSIGDIQGEDGFIYTSPVGYYGTTESGLTDMGGNVWNWCEDTYDVYPGSNQNFNADPQTKVMRGGSFFFDQNLEMSYTVSYRAPNTSETSLFNIGFRCASYF